MKQLQQEKNHQAWNGIAAADLMFIVIIAGTMLLLFPCIMSCHHYREKKYYGIVAVSCFSDRFLGTGFNSIVKGR